MHYYWGEGGERRVQPSGKAYVASARQAERPVAMETISPKPVIRKPVTLVNRFWATGFPAIWATTCHDPGHHDLGPYKKAGQVTDCRGLRPGTDENERHRGERGDKPEYNVTRAWRSSLVLRDRD